MKLESRKQLDELRLKAAQALSAQKHKILVCAGSGCIASGSLGVYEKLKTVLADKGLETEICLEDHVDHGDSVGVKKSGCQGFCEIGPLVKVEPEGYFYCKVKPEDCEDIVNETIANGRVVERLLYTCDDVTYTKQEDIPFYKNQLHVALEHCGEINAESIDEYIAVGGYTALEKALFDMTGDEIISEVSDSGLRGRGGAGFPTGKKWAQVAAHKETSEKYVVCNGDEGDPGAFMDRSVLEGDPHVVIEAMAIAAYAIGADQGYVYCRAEYPIAVKRLQIAIKQAREYGLLGKNIFGTGFNFDMEVRLGAGAFVCGEETALMTSIEGKRGEPRPRPPFPAVKGLFGQPTILNNVETYANVPQIINNGWEWFASMGTEKSKGTKVFALGGKINNTGLVEVPMGTTLREIIYDIGGGCPNGKKFKAAQTGGPSGGCIPASHLDIKIDYDNLTAIGSMMGSGGMIVMDEDNCMVDIARFFLDFTVDESCGKCAPCRIGTRRMLEILERIVEGKGEDGDIEKLENLANTIKATALCGLGQTAPNPVLSTLKYFRDEYEAHIYEKRCPAGHCKKLLTYKIDPAKCKGCTLCARNCPAGCISGKVREAHYIDTTKCLKCGACMEKCKFGAISRS